MQRAARTTALVIVPLATALSGHAGPIFNGPILPPGSFACTGVDNGTGFGCSGGAANLSPTSTNGLQGVSLFTDFRSGPEFFSGGHAQLILQASGLLANAGIPSGTAIPLEYAFNLSFLDGTVGATVSDWSLDFELFDGATAIGDSGDILGSPSDPSLSGGASFGDVIGLTTNATALVGDTLLEQVTLNVYWSQPVGEGNSTVVDDTLVIDVPGATSFDYQSTDIQSVPEPGTMGLTGAVLGLGGFFLMRRKKGWTLLRSGR